MISYADRRVTAILSGALLVLACSPALAQVADGMGLQPGGEIAERNPAKPGTVINPAVIPIPPSPTTPATQGRNAYTGAPTQPSGAATGVLVTPAPVDRAPIPAAGTGALDMPRPTLVTPALTEPSGPVAPIKPPVPRNSLVIPLKPAKRSVTTTDTGSHKPPLNRSSP